MKWRFFKQRLGALAFTAGGALWRLAHPTGKEPETVETLLVLNLLRIGDTVVTLPTLQALRAAYPRAKLVLAVRELTAPLVRHLDEVDELIVHEGDNSRSSCRLLAAKLPAADLAVVLDTSPWVAWAARRAGARRVVAYNSLGRGFAATERVPAPPMWNVALPDYAPHWNPPYQAVAWLKLALRVGARSEDPVPVWPVPREARRRATRWLESRNIAEFVHVHPGSDPSYRWPATRWKVYIETQTLPVVVGGSAADRPVLEEILAQVTLSGNKALTGNQVPSAPPVHLWCGEGDLADYGALLSLAQHVASVDTSAAHLAAAVGTPLSVLFGPGDPRIWGPRGKNAVEIVRATSDCVGCKAARCTRPTHECMESITPRTLMASQDRLL